MSDLEKNRSLSTQGTTQAICGEVIQICASADRICDIVAKSEGYSDFAEFKAAILREQEDLFAQTRIRAVNDV